MATQQRATLMLPTDANTGCIRSQDNQRVFKNGVIKHTQKLACFNMRESGFGGLGVYPVLDLEIPYPFEFLLIVRH